MAKPACMAGILVTFANLSARCGLMKLWQRSSSRCSFARLGRSAAPAQGGSSTCVAMQRWGSEPFGTHANETELDR
jgi:hypothetical protein